MDQPRPGRPCATTSLAPFSSTATISWVPQCANHRRPSCQRADSPITSPVAKVCRSVMAATSQIAGSFTLHTNGAAPDRHSYVDGQCDGLDDGVGNDQIGSGPGGGDQFGVALVDLFHPRGRVGGRLAEADVAGDQPLQAFARFEVAIPDLVEPGPYACPVALVEQQVVALGDDQAGGPRHGDAARDGLLQVAFEGGGVDRLLVVLPETTQQRR